MEQRVRVRINLSQGELEVEGSEAFVAAYAEPLRVLLDRLVAAAPPAAGASASKEPMAGGAGTLGSFGEFLHHLPSGATEVDRMLAAGFWCQEHNPDRAFATAEASRRLAEHGFRIGNPSQCVRQSIMAKRVFVVQKGRYRVSHHGKQYLRQLMGDIVGVEHGPDAGA